jgi:hypothetical protein
VRSKRRAANIEVLEAALSHHDNFVRIDLELSTD